MRMLRIHHQIIGEIDVAMPDPAYDDEGAALKAALAPYVGEHAGICFVHPVEEGRVLIGIADVMPEPDHVAWNVAFSHDCLNTKAPPAVGDVMIFASSETSALPLTDAEVKGFELVATTDQIVVAIEKETGRTHVGKDLPELHYHPANVLGDFAFLSTDVDPSLN